MKQSGEEWKGLSAEAVDFVKALLVKDPAAVREREWAHSFLPVRLVLFF